MRGQGGKEGVPARLDRGQHSGIRMAYGTWLVGRKHKLSRASRVSAGQQGATIVEDKPFVLIKVAGIL